MNILKTLLILSVFLTGLLTLVSCVEKASESEIDEACQHLVAYKSNQNAAVDTELLNKCKEDLQREKVSKEVALCRAKAPNLDAFWNLCR